MSMNYSPISSVRSVETKPLNYALNNESKISDSFADAMAVMGAGSVTGPAPVQYANARVEENAIAQRADASRANRAFNSIASAYQGVSATYDSAGNGGTYGMVGSQFDAAV